MFGYAIWQSALELMGSGQPDLGVLGRVEDQQQGLLAFSQNSSIAKQQFSSPLGVSGHFV